VSFVEQLGLQHPIVQAGMGGGIASGRLAGAVSAAGGLGTVGIIEPDRLIAELALARQLAPDRPIAANLLVPFTRRGHLEACARHRVEAVVLHAGFDRRLVDELRQRGVRVLATVGTAAQARAALSQGADGLVVQGVEAGGHLVGLQPALDALESVRGLAGRAPVLLAGGIADSADVSCALRSGADGVVAGTRFLLTDESGAHRAYKQRVLEAKTTLQTTLFGLGWPMRHRVVPNAATERWCRSRLVGALNQLSSPLSRLPLSVALRASRVQRPNVPLFTPAPLVEGQSESLVDATPLFAGETALRIDKIVPAGDAVRLLAGVSVSASPATIPSS
jgi:NAD(P)H-dependent flavin oxidoreductase YrpB (nitropropane dioxygenase family)